MGLARGSGSDGGRSRSASDREEAFDLLDGVPGLGSLEADLAGPVPVPVPTLAATEAEPAGTTEPVEFPPALSTAWTAGLSASGTLQPGAILSVGSVGDGGVVDGAFVAMTSVALDADGLPMAYVVGAGTAASPGTLTGGNGDQAMRADIARSTYGVTGSGIKVGILSDSYNVTGTAAADVANGNLPSGVTVLKEGPSGSADEGRAMAELVHKVAPGASIAFYSAFWSASDFAAGIIALANAGAKIIVDDVGYYAEPFYQDNGVVQAAIRTVTAQGVSYFTSAGNAYKNFYESSFSSLTTTLPSVIGTVAAHNFGGSSPFQSLSIARGATVTIDLQWDQPFASIGSGHSSASWLQLYLYTQNNVLVASATTNRIGGDPVQILQYTNNTSSTGFRLAIVDKSGPAPGLMKYIITGNGSVAINDPLAGVGSGTVFGHALSPEANVVGAVYAGDTPRFGVTTPVSETFSSWGPGEFLFDASGNRLASPQLLNAVDFAAPDGVPTSIFNPFYGTSAAAPDAAAVAALMLQARTTLTPTDVTALLKDSAIPMSNAFQSGAGFIQADQAVGYATTLTFNAAGKSALTGTHFDDSFIGAVGTHTLDGAGGINALSYAGMPAVNLNLATGIVTGVGIADTIQNFQSITGSDGADVLTGASGAETLFGSNGDDRLVASAGNDFLSGGGGTDAADYSTALAGVSVNLVNASASDGFGGNDTLFSIEQVIGSAFSDSLVGGAGNETFAPGGGSDTIDGGGGQDAVDWTGRPLAATINLATGTGSDSTGTVTLRNVEAVLGTTGADVITGDSGANYLQSNGGADTLTGGGGNDTIVLGTASQAGSEVVSAAPGDGADQLTNFVGGAGGDVLRLTGIAPTSVGVNIGAGTAVVTYGGSSSAVTVRSGSFSASSNVQVAGASFSYAGVAAAIDANLATGAVSIGGVAQVSILTTSLAGSGFADRLTAGSSGSNLDGGGGDDTLVGGGGADSLDGGAGIDLVSYAAATGGVTVNLSTGTASGAAGADVLRNIEGIVGSASFDTLTGNAADNYLVGGGGGDTLTGGAGNDTLVMGANGFSLVNVASGDGQDLIQGFTGTDRLRISGVSPGAVTVSGGGGAEFLTIDAAGNLRATSSDGGSRQFGYIGGALSGGWAVAGTGKLSSDGYGDLLFWNRISGDTDLFDMTASGPVERSLGRMDPRYAVQAIADVDGDGNSDVLWRDMSSGQLVAWKMSATGTVASTAALGPTVPTRFSIVGTGDLDGNGTTDLIWRDSASADVWVWELHPTDLAGTTTPIVAPIGQVTPGLGLMGTGDLDGDGRAELIWSNGAQVTRWSLTGTSVTSTATLGTVGSASWSLLGIGDWNADGRADILWQKPDGTGEAWLGGLQSNAVTIANAGAYGSATGTGLTHLVDTSLVVGYTGGSVALSGATGFIPTEANLQLAAASISFATASAAVTANLATGNVSVGGVAQAGVLTSTLVGSGFGDSLTAGTGGSNLAGGGGDDTLISGAGADTLDGGSGFDMVSYAGSNLNATVNLATGVMAGAAAGDVLSNVEAVYGTSFADSLTGDAGANLLNGAGGDDTLTGGAGNDTLVLGVGFGVVSVSAGDGQDVVQGFTSGNRLRIGGVSSGITVSGGGGAEFLTIDAAGNLRATSSDGGSRQFGYIGGALSGGWAVAGTGKLSSDGYGDLLFWNRISGDTDLFDMTASGPVERSLGRMDPRYAVQAIADVDGDGNSDVLWRDMSSGQLVAWKMSASGTVAGTAALGPTVPTRYSIVGTGDLDGNGTTDLIWRDSANADVWVWELHPTDLAGTTTPIVAPIGQVTPGLGLMGTGDLDGDGRAELIWSNGAQVTRWSLTGTSVTSTATLGTVGSASWSLLGIGDWNADGRADILWQKPDGTGEAWLGGLQSNVVTIANAGRYGSAIGASLTHLVDTSLVVGYTGGSATLVGLNGYLPTAADIRVLASSYSFAAATAAVTASLATGAVSVGGTAQASLQATSVVGSAFADTLTAGNGGSSLAGAGGADTLVAGAGPDTLDGGAGIDAASYAAATSGVTINLATAATGGGAAGDVLSNIEAVYGSSFADSLTGDAGANLLSGGGGADTLTGGAGNDTLVLGGGASVVAVSAGDGQDVVQGFKSGDLLRVSGISPGAVTVSGGGGAEFLTIDAAGNLRATSSDGGSRQFGYIGGALSGGWAVAGTGKLSADGYGDLLFWNRISGDTDLFDMTASGPVERSLGRMDPRYAVQAIADVDGDGNSDVLWRDMSSGQLVAWKMSASGTVAGTAALGPTVPTRYSIVGTGDLDGNGTTDLIWRDSANADVWVWELHPTDLAGTTTPIVAPIGQVTPGLGLMGTGDLDGDGRAELIWSNGAQVTSWSLTGTTVSSTATLGTPGSPSWSLLGIGDWNADGRADILWQKPDGTGEAWLGGLQSNAVALANAGAYGSAIGTSLTHLVDTSLVVGYTGGTATLVGASGFLPTAASVQVVAASYSFATASAAVTANLATGAVSVGGALQVSIQTASLVGSGFGDLLTASTGGSSLAGAGGDDTLVSGSGADTLDGGAGIDVVSFALATTGVTVNLSSGAVGGGAAGDVLSAIEGITGSAFADDLTGDAGANRLDDGGAGNDTLTGGAGNDTLVLGAGSDVVRVGVGDGQDRVIGFRTGSGGDVLQITGSVPGGVSLSVAGGADFVTVDAAGYVRATDANGSTRQVGYVGGALSGGWILAGMGSFSTDGYKDLLWVNRQTGDTELWDVRGGGYNGLHPGRMDPRYAFQAIADVDGDGTSDVLWRDTGSGQLVAWKMTATGTVAGTAALGPTVPTRYSIVGTGDLDGNGTTDLVWRDSANADVWVWELHPTDLAGTTTPIVAPIGQVTPGLGLLGTGDVDGDGRAELIWSNGAQVTSWSLTGTVVSTTATLGTLASPSWSLLGIGDWNADGRADILWQKPDGTGEAWLGGLQSNAVIIANAGAYGSAMGAGLGHLIDPDLVVTYGGSSITLVGAAGSGTINGLTQTGFSLANNLALPSSTSVSVGGGLSGTATLLGTSAWESLVGTSGSDTLQGNGGNDTLSGQGGYDVYKFNRGDGYDLVQNATGNTAPNGELDFAANIGTDQLWLSRSGNDLLVQVMGASASVTVSGWYASAAAQVQKIVTSDGAQLDAQLGALVTAMATYTAQHPGFNPAALPNAQAPADPTLQAVIAAAWHH